MMDLGPETHSGSTTLYTDAEGGGVNPLWMAEAASGAVVNSQEGIMRRIRGAIRRGELRPGHRLPLREELIRRFDTTSVTVQRAFNRLSADGFVMVPRGRSGTFVTERPPNLFRIGLVFPETKSKTLMNRHWLALNTAAAEYDGRKGKNIVSYYSIGPDHDDHERQHLLDDLRHERLAGLIVAWLLPLSASLAERFLPYPVPTVHLVGPNPDFHTVTLSGFPARAMAELARLGAQRVALLMNVLAYSQIESYHELAREYGLTLLPRWCFGLDTSHPEWAKGIMEILSSLPPEEGPDGLVVADDHFEETVAKALMRSGAGNRFKVVCHSNFPAVSRPALDAVRVGFDSRREIAEALAVLDRIAERERAGLPIETARITVLPCTEAEAADVRLETALGVLPWLPTVR